MELPKINAAQSRILSGLTLIPETRAELAEMLEEYRLAYDYEKHEEGLIFKSSKVFLKTLERLGRKDELGFAYTSSVMQVVEQRKCFRNLSESTSNRKVKADRYLIEYLIKKKWIAVHGSQARVTTEGSSRLMEFVNQY